MYRDTTTEIITQEYTRWTPDAIHCHELKSNCQQCYIPVKNPGFDCQMWKSVPLLLEKLGVPGDNPGPEGEILQALQGKTLSALEISKIIHRSYEYTRHPVNKLHKDGILESERVRQMTKKGKGACFKRVYRIALPANRTTNPLALSQTSEG